MFDSSVTVGGNGLRAPLNDRRDRSKADVRLPLFGRRFVYGKSDLDPEGNPKLKYAPKDIKQSLDDCKTKSDVIKELAKVSGASRFYIQHGLILMTRGGSNYTLRDMRIVDDGAISLGKGAAIIRYDNIYD